MSKTYISPAMQVVKIEKQDIVTNSLQNIYNNVDFIYGGGSTEPARAAGRRWDEWYEGY